MYTLKSIAQRGTLLGAVAALVLSAVLPAAYASADALNPLTERSLLLSSSAPGFMATDGSGNSNASPNAIGENYAPAGSGPNGMKSGETLTFRVSSTTPSIKAFTLQYCTTAAGKCRAPGNNAGDAKSGAPTPRDTNAVAHALSTPKSDLEYVGSWTQGTNPGQFQIMTNNSSAPYNPTAWTAVTASDWTLTATNLESQDHSDALTGKMNYVTLKSTTGQSLTNGEQVKIVFNPSESTYITNPGAGAFFVKLNTYDSDTNGDLVPGGIHNIDGGVTVANVMTDSIHITTKVLETMSFSVGTQNPDTQAVQHGTCDNMTALNSNRLNLGNPEAEYSLETGKAWDVFSYWRLSSNSSGGASVYYSGDTLRNTVGDSIEEMGTKKNSQIGTEQFGLALVNAGADTLDGGTFPSTHITPNVAPLAIQTPYNNGLVAIPSGGTDDISNVTTADNAEFSFLDSSLTTPELLAQNNTDVIRCSTAKMRYVANIAADTPAGVYTTKINYLAAPQY